MARTKRKYGVYLLVAVLVAAAGGGVYMFAFGLGRIDEVEPRIVTLDEPIMAVGLHTKTNMKSVFRDLPKVYRKYLDLKAKHGIPDLKEPWEYVSLSDDFTEDKTWVYHTGHVVAGFDKMPAVFTSFTIPAGNYAVFPLRPRNKILLGLAMGRMKRHIYLDWLPDSKYEFSGKEFEYNNEEMSKKNPSFIDLYVGIKEKE